MKERRAEKRDAITAALEELVLDLDKVRSNKKQAALLTSVAEGLYDELDKLSKKAPVDEATDLVVDHVNDLINDVRTLASADPYIQRVKPFVPAGNNPEHRDVLLILKQIRQGLDRYVPGPTEREGVLNERIGLARGLLVALKLYIDGTQTQITRSDLEADGVSLPEAWWTGRDIYGKKTFGLGQIDDLDADTLLVKDQ